MSARDINQLYSPGPNRRGIGNSHGVFSGTETPIEFIGDVSNSTTLRRRLSPAAAAQPLASFAMASNRYLLNHWLCVRRARNILPRTHRRKAYDICASAGSQ